MFSKANLLKLFAVVMVIVFAACSEKAIADEPEMNISYVQNGITHAVILCRASEELCVVDSTKAVSKELFAKEKGFNVLKNVSTIILNGDKFFVLTVSSK